MSDKLNSTAPVAIFLQVSSEPGDCYSPFPSDTSEVSWCADRQGGAEVRYIRADLAAAAAASLDAGVEATIAQLEAQLEEERARNAAAPVAWMIQVASRTEFTTNEAKANLAKGMRYVVTPLAIIPGVAS